MINTNIAMALTAVTAVSVLALGGCASSEVDRQYGKAVHQMLAAQAYHPQTLKQPSTVAPEGVDPDSAKAAVDAMRKDTAERTHTEQPIIFTYGAPSGASNQ